MPKGYQGASPATSLFHSMRPTRGEIPEWQVSYLAERTDREQLGSRDGNYITIRSSKSEAYLIRQATAMSTAKLNGPMWEDG